MSARTLLTRLLDYIEEQAKEVDPRGFCLSAAKGFIRNPTQLRGLPGVTFDISTEGDHTWLRVERLEAASPPAVDEKLRGLIRIDDNPFGNKPTIDEVAMRAHIAAATKDKPPADVAELERRSRATLDAALTRYVLFWEAWAEGEKPRRKSIDLYGDLFAVRHALEAEETSNPSELVWGMGISAWNLSYKDRDKTTIVNFEYPLLTQQMEVAIDDVSMALTLRPRATNTRYEGDVFAACSVAGAAEIERAVREQIKRDAEKPVSPFDRATYEPLLKLVAGNLDSKGAYTPVLATNGTAPAAGEHLAVTDAWALFVRPRSNNYLIEDLHRLKQRLADNCDIPEGPGALVNPPSDEPVGFSSITFRGLSSRGVGGTGAAAKELYFPLPYNGEQVTIVQQLEQAEGVTVQGPPGTGKTHTIANIICHYLASGKRVLVTSKGEPALEVLQDKIPPEVRSLTVSLLTNDRESVRQFQAAIETIQARVSQLNPELTRQEIEHCRGQIDRAHAELGKIDARVDAIALAQLSEIEVDGQPMRAQKLADLVVTGKERYGWFDDSVTPAVGHGPPLSETEGGHLREVRRKLGHDLTYVNARVPAADSLFPPQQVAELHEVLVRMREIEDEVRQGALLPLKAFTPEVLAAARQLLEGINTARGLLAEIDDLGERWAHDLRIKCRLPSLTSERGALEALFDEISALVEARSAFLQRPVEVLDNGLRSPKVLEAVNRGAESGKPFGVLSFGNGDAKELVGQIRVAGLPPQSAEDWQHVKRYFDLHSRVTSFVARWNQFAPTMTAPTLESSVTSLRRIEMVATAARKAHRLATRFDTVLVRKAEEVFVQVPTKHLTGSTDELSHVRSQLMSHLTRADLAKAATQLATLKAKLVGMSGPVSEALVAFVDHELGKQGLAAERAAADYARLLAEVQRVQTLSAEFGFVRECAARLQKAGASKFATRIASVPVSSAGEDTAFPVDWRQAWTWARVRSHLDAIEAREELVTLAARRRDLEQGLSKFYGEMVAKAAWLQAKQNATPRVLQALQGYATAIRRIGMGTGTNAIRYRRDAREHMLNAVGAVPCWIMSHAKVSESVPADIGAFDLVIVDEASQSDLWALPAILRGKKILVVGDDKQVSPDAGFIAAQRIQELRDRFLADQPYKEEMTPEKSLYDLASRVFAAHSVMLREHFRCVPPIIAYSNRFYKGAIQPLRIPRASERIDPPLVDVYLEDGIRDGRNCNEREAEFIAEEIKALLSGEQFKGRSIGVVSMLGMEQAKRIDERVRRMCDAGELHRRRFECGDAPTFQGSERDIMFLSMVVDPSNCRALSGQMYDQRFNVAASRARDRMYLVRSVTTSHLSDRDLRMGLLQHFDKPMVVDREEAEILIDRCQSGFERQVYSALVEHGYKVTPQVQTGAYFIDMVVEGAGDVRLAIECDGDEFHGPDRWSADMTRQRNLERAGWTFWRCFASTWSLRRKDVMTELVERLTGMGIEPLGAIDRAPKLVEKRAPKSKAEFALA